MGRQWEGSWGSEVLFGIRLSNWQLHGRWGTRRVSPGVVCLGVQWLGEGESRLPVPRWGRAWGGGGTRTLQAVPSLPCTLSLPGVSSDHPHPWGKDAEAWQGFQDLALPHKVRQAPRCPAVT